MVPFAPSSMQADDFRHYRSCESYPEVFDGFPSSIASPFCDAGRSGPFQLGGTKNNPPLLPSYSARPPNLSPSSFIKGALSLIPLPSPDTNWQVFNPQCTCRPESKPSYENGIAPCAGSNYGRTSFNADSLIDNSGPSNQGDCVDLDQLPSATLPSPNSTVSCSEVASFNFTPDRPIGTSPARCSSDPLTIDLEEPQDVNEEVDQPDGTAPTEHASLRGRSLNRPPKMSATMKRLERRRKNNEASRKSRAQKKDRFLMSVREVESLKSENEQLKNFLGELDVAIRESNDALMAAFRRHLTSNAIGLL